MLILGTPVRQPLALLVIASALLGFSVATVLYLGHMLAALRAAEQLRKENARLREDQQKILALSERVELPVPMSTVIRNNVFSHTPYDFSAFAARARGEPRP